MIQVLPETNSYELLDLLIYYQFYKTVLYLFKQALYNYAQRNSDALAFKMLQKWTLKYLTLSYCPPTKMASPCLLATDIMKQLFSYRIALIRFNIRRRNFAECYLCKFISNLRECNFL